MKLCQNDWSMCRLWSLNLRLIGLKLLIFYNCLIFLASANFFATVSRTTRIIFAVKNLPGDDVAMGIGGGGGNFILCFRPAGGWFSSLKLLGLPKTCLLLVVLLLGSSWKMVKLWKLKNSINFSSLRRSIIVSDKIFWVILTDLMAIFSDTITK